MKNLTKVAERIRQAVEKKEPVVLFADSDLDGITSAIMLEETIEHLGHQAQVYVSSRDRWGHGMSVKAVDVLRDQAPALLVSLDCGIGNFDGFKEAKKLGFFTIIIDHHMTLGGLPEADIVLNPHQEGDDYPFKKLANAGIVYKLVAEILQERFVEHKNSFLELTTIATVADMVPREEDNKIILEEGTPLLENPQRPALQVLREKVEENFLDKTVSLLNITTEVNSKNEGYFFLRTQSKEEAEAMAEKLIEKQKERKRKLEEGSAKLLEKMSDHEEGFVLLGGDFEESLGGKMTSIVMNKTQKSVFLYKIDEQKEEGVGSVRTVMGFYAVEIMNYCKDYLKTYGGHPEAAGFVVDLEKVEDFREKLREYYKKHKN